MPFSGKPRSTSQLATLAMLKALARRPTPYLIRNDLTDAEFDAFRRIDEVAYGVPSVPEGVLRGWWTAYPRGLIGLFKGQSLVGGMGIWPLSESWADRLKTGRISEPEIGPAVMRTYRDAPACFWYIGGVLVIRPLRRTRASVRLITGGLKTWLDTCPIGFPLELLSLGVNQDGQALLEGFGFRSARDGALMDQYTTSLVRIPSRADFVGVLRQTGIELQSAIDGPGT